MFFDKKTGNLPVYKNAVTNAPLYWAIAKKVIIAVIRKTEVIMIVAITFSF
jgi:hypothetical protein